MKKLFCATVFCLIATTASAASVSFRWDPNDPTPDGYRIFKKTGDYEYDYSSPSWEGQETTATIDIPDDGQTYYFVCRAFSGARESGDSNEVTVLANQPPVAEAGFDHMVYEGIPAVLLSSAGSYDPEGGPVAYLWEQISGAPAELNGTGMATMVIVAPEVQDTEALESVLEFRLTVTDDQGMSSTDTVKVTIFKQKIPQGFRIEQ